MSMTTSTITTAARQMLSSMKTTSTSDLSEMLLEFYKANNAMIPKNDHFQKSPSTSVPTTFAMTGPLSANSIVSAIVSSANNGVKPSSTNTTPSAGPGSILSSVTNKLMATLPPVVHPKNLNSDEMLTNLNALATSSIIAKRLANPFHPRIKYSNVNNKSTTTAPATLSSTPVALTSTSPAVAATTNATNSREGQPPQITPTAPAAAVTAAAAAAALLRDEYHHLHQLRAQELLKQQPHGPPIPPLPPNSHFYMPNFLKNDKYAESYLSSSDEGDEDDEEDNKYPEIEDIHLIEGTKAAYQNQGGSGAGDTDYMSDESHKYSMIAAQALRNLEYSLSDYGGGSPSEEPLYQCRHCGKKYRWKSTLRRHENVECGGKEPSHQCPYCPYKSKQRGNLGVHVRKHHSNLPQLASKRRSKYSQPRD